MKLLLADDHSAIASSIKELLISNTTDLSVDIALNQQELKFLLNASKDQNTFYDLLIQDIIFGEDNAFDFIESIKIQHPKLKIVFFTSIDDSINICRALNIVDGYVLKSEPFDKLIESIHCVCNGDKYISREARRKIKLYTEPTVVLSKREKQILKEIFNEKTTKEIAQTLNISVKTVEMHRSNLFVKLGVKNSIGLVKKAIALNLLK